MHWEESEGGNKGGCAGEKLVPTTSSMSSAYYANGNPSDCIDGSEATFCFTELETAPWLALDYGSEVQIGSVVTIIYNSPSWPAAKTRNLNVRVSSSLPVSGSQMFTGGQLLGTFAGPGTSRQRIVVAGETQLTGRYVVLQMDFRSGADHFSLHEVSAWSNGRISYFTFEYENKSRGGG